MRLLLVITIGSAILSGAAVARADVIYGTIRLDSMSAGRLGAARYSVTCREGQSYGGSLQSSGEYKVYVEEHGTCKFRLFVGPPDEPLIADVRSYDEPVRYDFTVVETPSGYRLARR